MSIPASLEKIIQEFGSAPKSLRLPLLLEYAGRVPPLPPELSEHHERMERVHECQTPIFIATEIDGEGRATLHFDAPEEAPTTRGFAGILAEGLSGLPVTEILETPGDFYTAMGLQELISPLRVRGMAAILNRIQRQLEDQQAGG